MIQELQLLTTIGPVAIYTGWSGKYVAFIANLDIDNDGTGPSHGDPSYQSQTTYSPYLNADVDQYVVTPPQVRKGVAPVVIGCQARVTNLHKPDQWGWGVTGDVGPSNKCGEAAYCLAKILNHSITHNTGDTSRIYLYEFWPGIAAVVGDKKYKLQPA